MGQYYNILIERENKWETYGVFGYSKLMEHSYFYNEAVNTICRFIVDNPAKVAWVGHYAHQIFELWDVQGITEEDLDNIYEKAWHRECTELISQRDIDEGMPLRFVDKMMISNPIDIREYYLINYEQKTYIDMSKYYEENITKNGCVHPLPILTAIGNGLDWGDFEGVDEEYAGLWAYELVGVSKSVPEDFTEVMFHFIEEYK